MMRVSNKVGNTTEVITLDGSTYTRTVNGTQQEQRPLTQLEQATLAQYETDTTASNNKSSIETNLTQDMAAMQAIIDTPNATINSNPATHIKNIARNLKRLDRTALKDYTGTD